MSVNSLKKLLNLVNTGDLNKCSVHEYKMGARDVGHICAAHKKIVK